MGAADLSYTLQRSVENSPKPLLQRYIYMDACIYIYMHIGIVYIYILVWWRSAFAAHSMGAADLSYTLQRSVENSPKPLLQR